MSIDLKQIKLVCFESILTAYFPPPPKGYASEAEARMEGGALDRLGNPLHTLQDFLAWKVPYVSVAMDVNAFVYGTPLCIPSFNHAFGVDIVFRVVDMGNYFRNKGRTEMDICVMDKRASEDPIVNQSHIVVAALKEE